MLVTLPSPIPEFQHTFLPFKVLRARERALTPCFSAVFNLDSHLSPLRSLGARHDERIFEGLKYVSIKLAQANLQKCIT